MTSNLNISEELKESVYSNLERALDYVQDYVNIRGCTSMNELQSNAIDCSPTDMAEVYNDEASEDITTLSFEDAKVKLYTYALYNVGYHSYEGITWDVPDEQMPIFENSHLRGFYQAANVLVDGLNATVANPDLKTSTYLEYIAFSSGRELYTARGEYMDWVETIVKTFMDSFYNFVTYYKKPGEFDRYIKMWQEDIPNTSELWRENKLFMQEQEARSPSNIDQKEEIQRLVQKTKTDAELYQQIEQTKKIEDTLALLPPGLFQFTNIDDLKNEFKTLGYKYNFKRAKAYVLAKYLHAILKPYFELKTTVINIHPNDRYYFNSLRVAPYISDFLISLLAFDDSEYRAKITTFADEQGLNKTMPNGKKYAWSPIHIAPNLKNPEGVDLLLACLNWNKNGFMMLPFMFGGKRFLNMYF